TTKYAYDGADRLSQTTLPDGSAMSFNFNGSAGPGLLSTITVPQGQEAFTYGTGKGQVTGMAGPGSEHLAFNYTLAQLQSLTWSGPVAGSVSWTLDNNFRLASEAVNGGSPVNFQYDKDGLLTLAGDLALTYAANNGQLTSTKLGTVSESVGY